MDLWVDGDVRVAATCLGGDEAEMIAVAHPLTCPVNRNSLLLC